MSQYILQPLFVVLLFILSILTITIAQNQLYHEKNRLGAPKTTVSILNNLPDNLDLKLHCQSRDDDLGIQIVHFNGTFVWSFHVNFFKTTSFSCSFTWRFASSTYDIYRAKRDDNFRCPTYCSWVVRDDGVYGYTENGHINDIHFYWRRRQISDIN